YVSTLWDYIRRAMPWNEPKSLPVDDVYAVTAYMLNLAEIVPADFTLSNTTMADAQKRLPNRNGLTTQHAMWPGTELGGMREPDVRAAACMKDCDRAQTITKMPEHARNAHGNLAQQNRLVGAQHGAVTIAQSETAQPVAAMPAGAAPKNNSIPTDLLQKHSCTACHTAESKLVGPSWSDISKKHAGKTAYLIGKIRSGGSGVWGAVPMPPQNLNDDEVGRLASWLAQGMSR
ncbi:MAG: cytochrome C, partial [Ramlibacter sp.]|nr:cytochrome C [Ramlibacter sp.]